MLILGLAATDGAFEAIRKNNHQDVTNSGKTRRKRLYAVNPIITYSLILRSDKLLHQVHPATRIRPNADADLGKFRIEDVFPM